MPIPIRYTELPVHVNAICSLGNEIPMLFSECDTNHYGIDCENECKCNKTNTVDCDSGDGSCICKTGWEGHLCQSDVNECGSTPNPCGANSVCTNNDGSYTCACQSGWTMNSNNECKGAIYFFILLCFTVLLLV